ncbi:MAG: MBL fold metallo-hydrolase [Thermoplasmata archaeon]|nr:MBL fold metallo-hydrolase [Thermoplasmata archaeon]
MQIKKFLGFGYESNVYLIIDKNIALIDAGTGFETPFLIKKLRENGIKKIDYIILTHEHFDHCGGASEIKKFMGGKIAMHVDAADVLEKGLSIYASFFNAIQRKASVEIKLVDGDEIKIGETNLKIIHTPGHSPGSICIYEAESKSIFSGDTVFANGGIGRTDFYNGNHEDLINSIKKLASIKINAIYPGHGDYITKNAEAHIKMALSNANLL